MFIYIYRSTLRSFSVTGVHSRCTDTSTVNERIPVREVCAGHSNNYFSNSNQSYLYLFAVIFDFIIKEEEEEKAIPGSCKIIWNIL